MLRLTDSPPREWVNAHPEEQVTYSDGSHRKVICTAVGRKELIDGVRDRRSLMSLAFSAVISPLLFGLMFTVDRRPKLVMRELFAELLDTADST